MSDDTDRTISRRSVLKKGTMATGGLVVGSAAMSGGAVAGGNDNGNGANGLGRRATFKPIEACTGKEQVGGRWKIKYEKSSTGELCHPGNPNDNAVTCYKAKRLDVPVEKTLCVTGQLPAGRIWEVTAVDGPCGDENDGKSKSMSNTQPSSELCGLRIKQVGKEGDGGYK